MNNYQTARAVLRFTYGIGIAVMIVSVAFPVIAIALIGILASGMLWLLGIVGFILGVAICAYAQLGNAMLDTANSTRLTHEALMKLVSMSTPSPSTPKIEPTSRRIVGLTPYKEDFEGSRSDPNWEKIR